ncbi:hypothetical protein G6F22_017001 [Rhizopus arrhizus]|nr:hypothetical protein G6F22_017001 [Rhizopus arrhizus]
MRRFSVPGAAVMVLQDGRLIHAKAYGQRDLARDLAVRTDTPFEIGSITKQFTAAAVVQLQEAGKLSLDDPLARYLPDAPHAHEVTLRQLLSHTSGLHDYFDGPEQEGDALVTQPIAFDRLIARIREVDTEMPLMLDAGWYAAADGFNYWPAPLDDAKLLYSVHMYEPYAATSAPNQKRAKPWRYPGSLPAAADGLGEGARGGGQPHGGR